MTWVRLDEDFANHPKVRQAGPLALAMQVAALGYCNKYLTDGFLPRSVVPSLLNLEGLAMRCWSGELVGGGEDATWQLIVEDLIDAGLWQEVKGGYVIHDYLDYQPSRAQVLAERAQKQEAGRKGGQASGQARAQARGKQVLEQKGGTSQAQTQAESKPAPVPVPVPVPDSVSASEAEKHPPQPPKGGSAAPPTSGGGQAVPFSPASEASDPVPEELQKRWNKLFFAGRNGLVNGLQWQNRIDLLNTLWADYESLSLHTEALNEVEQKARSPSPDARLKYYSECLATISKRYVRVGDG